MSLVLVGSTSGSITLQEPAVAGSTTINLPASTGTMALLQTPSFATTIGVGNATPSTSGAGITFPATQSASSNANTLDDYEEGTWTPVPARLTGGAITSTGAITVQGTYTKIGRLVYLYCDIDIAGTVTQGSSNTVVDGLPFTPARRRNAGSISNATALTNYPFQSTEYGVNADNAFVALNFQVANAWKAGGLQIVCMYEI